MSFGSGPLRKSPRPLRLRATRSKRKPTCEEYGTMAARWAAPYLPAAEAHALYWPDNSDHESGRAIDRDLEWRFTRPNGGEIDENLLRATIERMYRERGKVSRVGPLECRATKSSGTS